MLNNTRFVTYFLFTDEEREKDGVYVSFMILYYEFMTFFLFRKSFTVQIG